jgi:hypothetical protein
MILGYDSSNYSSATAAAAVYGAVNLWSAVVLYTTFRPYYVSILEDETLEAGLAGRHPPGVINLLGSSRWGVRFRLPFVFYQPTTHPEPEPFIISQLIGPI